MTFSVAVDLVVLTIRHDRLNVLLVRRGIPPYQGQWALPGGFVLPDEDLIDAAARELREEAGIVGHLEQLATYGTPGRDPRGQVVTVAHLALLPDAPAPTAGSDASHAAWQPVDSAPLPLAFDHDRILSDGVERARAKLEYTPLATAFCPPTFTIGQLRGIYEAVWGRSLDPRNFHRKVTGTTGFIEPTEDLVTGTPGRPARLYRRGHTAILYPPLLRPGS